MLQRFTVIPMFMVSLIFSVGLSASEITDADFREQFLQGKLNWQQVQEKARQEGEVNFYYWGGDDNLNIWIDSVVKQDLASLGVNLVPHRITSTRDVVDLVISESAAGKGLGEGSVDLLWVNGENFYTLSEQDQLFGSFVEHLPEHGNFEWNETDARSSLNLSDFGYPTLGREVPWSGEQYVCAANRALLSRSETPSDFTELRTWLEGNPGYFTYVKPPHYLGNTFVQQVMYALNPSGTGAEPFQKNVDDYTAEQLSSLLKPGMDYLKALAPYLAGARGNTVRYPENADAMMRMFQNSEIAIECQFGLFHVANLKKQGKMPDSAEEIIFPKGNMIKNKNYLAIMSNSPNPAAALVFANYMSSFKAQKEKVEYVGYPVGIDPWKLNSDQQQQLFDVTPPHFGVTQQQLDANIAPDTNASLVNIIEYVWLQYIEQNSTKAFQDIVAEAMEN